MTAKSTVEQPSDAIVGLPRDESEEGAELRTLRLRVGSQERLIAAMIEENEEIHALRRRNHQLELYLGRVLDLAPVRLALRLRQRLRRRSSG
jgi:hypothetical protein